MKNNLRKLRIVCTILLIFSLKLSAPSLNSIIIPRYLPCEPYKQLLYAVASVETARDTLAYNPIEGATGIFQIRSVRLFDYNKRTGNSYSRKDLFNYQTSEKIFLYYADQIGPYNLEKIARRWNGSGKLTDNYWRRIVAFL
jgi:hypothetical protein